MSYPSQVEGYDDNAEERLFHAAPLPSVPRPVLRSSPSPDSCAVSCPDSRPVSSPTLRPVSAFAPPMLPRPRPRPRRRWREGGFKARWQLGSALFMAEEIAAQLPRGARVLDVGCGDGFIAHHLSGLLGRPAVGVDVREATLAPIDYASFDGVHLPHPHASFDALVSAYVLHHAADAPALLADMARVLRPGGTLVVYEDVPGTVFDRLLCWRHDHAWRARSGRCSFHRPQRWRAIFEGAGFGVRLSMPLSRWRDLTHPIAQQFFVLTHSI